ncbi:MAG: hypothetical protein IPH76_19255 [Xanthomonadales bacterium]|nr:hypothetical protein [Xanthomonadales bacterium]
MLARIRQLVAEHVDLRQRRPRRHRRALIGTAAAAIQRLPWSRRHRQGVDDLFAADAGRHLVEDQHVGIHRPQHALEALVAVEELAVDIPHQHAQVGVGMARQPLRLAGTARGMRATEHA